MLGAYNKGLSILPPGGIPIQNGASECGISVGLDELLARAEQYRSAFTLRTHRNSHIPAEDYVVSVCVLKLFLPLNPNVMGALSPMVCDPKLCQLIPTP
jgi:hypothetical protein